MIWKVIILNLFEIYFVQGKKVLISFYNNGLFFFFFLFIAGLNLVFMILLIWNLEDKAPMGMLQWVV